MTRTTEGLFQSVKTTQAIARTQGRLTFLQGHTELPTHFAELINQCLVDLNSAHQSHQGTLDYHAGEIRRIISNVAHAE